MIRFLLRRLAWTALVLWFVLTATFAIHFVLPGDPVAVTLGGPAARNWQYRTRFGNPLPGDLHVECAGRCRVGWYSCDRNPPAAAGREQRKSPGGRGYIAAVRGQSPPFTQPHRVSKSLTACSPQRPEGLPRAGTMRMFFSARLTALDKLLFSMIRR